MTQVWKPTLVQAMVKREYGYRFLYPPPLKRAQERSKRTRNGQDIAKTFILVYLGHFWFVLGVLGLVLTGINLRVRVRVLSSIHVGYLRQSLVKNNSQLKISCPRIWQKHRGDKPDFCWND